MNHLLSTSSALIFSLLKLYPEVLESQPFDKVNVTPWDHWYPAHVWVYLHECTEDMLEKLFWYTDTTCCIFFLYSPGPVSNENITSREDAEVNTEHQINWLSHSSRWWWTESYQMLWFKGQLRQDDSLVLYILFPAHRLLVRLQSCWYF